MRLQKSSARFIWNRHWWLQAAGMCAFLALASVAVYYAQAQAAYVGLTGEQRQSASNVHAATKTTLDELGASVQRFGLRFDTGSSGCYKNPSGSRGSCEEQMRTSKLNMTEDEAASFIANARRLAEVAKAHGWLTYQQNKSYDWTVHQDDAAEWLKTGFLELRYKKNINGAHCDVSLNAGTIGKGELSGYIACRQEADATGLQYFPG